MKKQLFFLLFTVVTSFPLFAQFPGSTHSGNGWHLRGECEITMKNGEKIQFDGKIKNTEIEGSGIDYKDVDFITLVKTFYTGAFQRFNGTVYRYVNLVYCKSGPNTPGVLFIPTARTREPDHKLV